MKIPKVTGQLRTGLTLLALSALPFSTAWGEPLEKASITEAVNTVSYQSSENAPQKPATTGTIIHSDNVVRTGVKSRAELTFNDNTVTRMGANSAFTFDEKAQKLNLEQGTMLFCKPKEASAFEISTPAATCAISGTTGFLQTSSGKGNHFNFLFGLVEGHTSIVIHGTSYDLEGGNLLMTTPDGQVHIGDFDVAAFLQKNGLIQHFKGKLPNQREINQALKKYLALVERGFIKSTDGQYLYPDLEFYNTAAGQRDFAAQVLAFEQIQADHNQPKPQYIWNDGNSNGDNGGR